MGRPFPPPWRFVVEDWLALPVFWHTMAWRSLASYQPKSCVNPGPIRWSSMPWTCGAAVVLAWGLASSCRWAPPEFDLVVRGGLVLDGTGSPAMRTDVGVKGDRVAALGDLGERTAAATIDASGRVVAPGFIDTQGQSGRLLLEDGAGASHILQGITSEVIGEASTPALWVAESADLPLLNRLGMRFDWSGVGGFLERLSSRGITVNVGTLAPLNQLRVDVIGTTQRAARPAELEEMRRRLDLAMREGAFGLSSALIYPPGSYASTEEIVTLARTAAVHGGRYVTHVRGEGDRLERALDEAIAVADQASIPVVIYHLKIATRAKWKSMPAIVARIERARARTRRLGDGLPVPRRRHESRSLAA